MKPHSCSRYRYICMYMSSMPDDVFKNSACLGDRKRWRTTSLTVPEELKPPTSTQLNSPPPCPHHPALFLPPNKHTERERERKRRKISMRRRVSSRIIALWIGIAPWRTKVKLISIFFLFFLFFGCLFCFAFGPPPSGIVRRRPWTWTTSQWLAIKLYKNSLLQCNNNNKITVINMSKCDTRQLYDTFTDICWVCGRRKISKGRENFWTLFS